MPRGECVCTGPGAVVWPRTSAVGALWGSGGTTIPGLVDTHSHVGIYPRPAVPAHGDGNEGTNPVQAGLRGPDAVFPGDPGFRSARAGGGAPAKTTPGTAYVHRGRRGSPSAPLAQRP